MRKVCISLVSLLMVGAYLGCGDEVNPVRVEEFAPQLVVATVGVPEVAKNVGGAQAPRGAPLGFMARGIIVGDPLPGFEYVSLDDSVFAGKEYCRIRDGFMEFRSGMIPGLLMSASLEIKTSAGALTGSCSYPDVVTNVMMEPAGPLSLGDTLKISWTTSADFVVVRGQYNYMIDQTFHSLPLDTFVTADSLVFDLFSYDGEVTFYSIVPYDGPVPNPGARSNMTGVGRGYLYYEGEMFPLEDARERLVTRLRSVIAQTDGS
jgi:hypothetical protein